MAETQSTRRSTRARKPVASYAAEQADQQLVTETSPAKRKKATSDVEIDGPAAKKTKSSKAHFKSESEEGNTVKKEAPATDGDFKPQPKKSKKSATKRKTAIGKLDSTGIMRLDTRATRPPGERKPPQIWDVPARKNAAKGKSSNLAAILAESFEERRERRVSKIPRLKPGAQETRLKE